MPRGAKPVPPGTAYPAVVIVAGMLLGAGVIVGAGLVATRAVQRIGGWLLAHADRVIVGAVERQRARRMQQTTWCVEEVRA